MVERICGTRNVEYSSLARTYGALINVYEKNHVCKIRYRCENCPLTFLKKKSFILHHREKHKEAIEPWCSLCYKVFDSLKQREDHQCGKIENMGRITICHKHDPPMQFKHQSDLLEHIKTHHSSEDNELTPLQNPVPFAIKSFCFGKI